MEHKQKHNLWQLLQVLALQLSLAGLAAMSSTFAAALGLVPFFVVGRMATAVYLGWRP